MSDVVMVILDLSDEVRAFLERQDVDLYQELRHELPSIKLSVQPDPAAPAGSRDIVTVISLAASLVAAFSPVLVHILERHSPHDSSKVWVIEEVETRRPDGTVTIYRKPVLSNNKHAFSHQAAAGAWMKHNKKTGA